MYVYLGDVREVMADHIARLVSRVEEADPEDDAVVVASVGRGRHGDVVLEVRLHRVAGPLPQQQERLFAKAVGSRRPGGVRHCNVRVCIGMYGVCVCINSQYTESLHVST